MSEEEKNNFENDKTDHETDSSTENDIQTELENDFAKNLFPLIHEYKQKLSTCEDKLQRALADYQNLEKRNQTEIQQRVLQKTNQLMLSFIGIYEDFIRAKTSLVNDSTSIEGLDVVIKNMENFLSENNIKAIEAVGEIFDPKFHEAVSTVEDSSLDEGTITQEVAKGYISFQEVIKPSKVIVSKKLKGVMKDD